ncbi:WD repeat-containing protein [Drosera capensis]
MEIELGELPFDVDFHPADSLVAAGLISGDLLLYRFAADSTPQRLLGVSPHEQSCRALRFINEGRAIVTGSPDCSIAATDVQTGSVVHRLENAHTDAINRIINLTETTIASGDDAGCIKVWDTRQRSCCNTFNAHEEYISDMTFASDPMKLIATSGDGMLSVQSHSEFSEDELLSVVLMKNGRKVICGTQSGALLLYSWGFFKDCSDRFIELCPNSLDALVKFDEDRIVTGSSSGVISLVNILPNRVLQPIAEHSEYPVERLAFSHDKKVLSSLSHDHVMKLWDMDELLQDSGSCIRKHTAAADSDSDKMDVDSSQQKSSKGTKRKNGDSVQAASSFFADM